MMAEAKVISSVIADPQAHAKYLWRSGRLVPWNEATVHISAVGHASVASVFEGLKAYWNEERQQLYCFRLREHMERLIDSARLARIACNYTADQLVDAVLELLRANDTRQDTYIRPWLFAEGLIRDQMVPANVPTELAIDQWPFRSHPAGHACTAGISTWVRISERLMPPRIKAFSNYSNGRLGMIEAHQNGYDAPVFLNELGMVTESAGACIAILRHGTVLTPPLSAGILDSITRQSLLQLLPAMGIPVEEKDLTRTDLYMADEAFFMGTGWEVLPIRAIDHMEYAISAPGPRTQDISRQYLACVRGELDAAHRWLTPVLTD
jgi:branched-chain amino acid aminotransferase